MTRTFLAEERRPADLTAEDSPAGEGLLVFVEAALGFEATFFAAGVFVDAAIDSRLVFWPLERRFGAARKHPLWTGGGV